MLEMSSTKAATVRGKHSLNLLSRAGLCATSNQSALEMEGPSDITLLTPLRKWWTETPRWRDSAPQVPHQLSLRAKIRTDFTMCQAFPEITNTLTCKFQFLLSNKAHLHTASFLLLGCTWVLAHYCPKGTERRSPIPYKQGSSTSWFSILTLVTYKLPFPSPPAERWQAAIARNGF